MYSDGLVLRDDLPARGPRDLKNDTGLVNFLKDFEVTPPPPPPKNGYVRLKKAILGKTYS